MIGMYAEPRDRDSIPMAKQAALLDGERAGGDSSVLIAETQDSGAGAIPTL